MESLCSPDLFSTTPTLLRGGGGVPSLRGAYHPPSSEGERPEFNPDDYFFTNEAGEQMHEDVRDTMFYL